MRVILDLGLQKTGSKARQSFFAGELQRLRGVRAFLPSTGRSGPWHRSFYEALARGETGPLQALVDELARDETGADLAILSYEELHKLGDDAIRQLCDNLPGLEAVLFIRRQDQLTNSLHNQFHKSHRLPLRELERFEADLLQYDTTLDHGRTLRRWVSLLGSKHVHPILFEKRVSSIQAFFRAIGIQVDMVGYQESRPNRAMDAHGLAVLRGIKQLAHETELLAAMTQAHRVLAPHFAAIEAESEHYTLDMEQRRTIMAHYQDSNEWVRQHFFPARSQLFEPLEAGIQVKPDYAKGRSAAEAILRTVRQRDGTPPRVS